ncbi:hypothetical protein OQA88_5485 [Cercophora sp. LCS_1]
MSTEIEHQNSSEVVHELVHTNVPDATAGTRSSQTPPVHQAVDRLETAQEDGDALRRAQTVTDEIKAVVDTAIVSESDVLKLQTLTPAVAIAASDVSLDDSMSTRSSSSSIPTEMTVPPTLDDNTEDPDEANVEETSSRILDVILGYSLNKFDSTAELHNAGRSKFLAVISRFVRTQQKVVMCLPAFPFKSANKVEKVLGTLPDKAEELALNRLNTMCVTIAKFYEPGAELTVISDGLVYNDLLGISDLETWRYGSALRAMADGKGFSHLAFSRLQDLVAVKNVPDDLVELTYVANATNFRRTLFNVHGRDGDIDIDHEIATNPDTLMTYRGYSRFLESDLLYIFGPRKVSRGYKRDVKYLAKQMLIRGYTIDRISHYQAFAGAVKARFPNHLRLSIHQSTGEHKISISLLNTKTGFTTPWHCSVALMANGEWLSALTSDFKSDPLLELVEEDGRPSYFREVPRQQPYLKASKKAPIVTEEERAAGCGTTA